MTAPHNRYSAITEVDHDGGLSVAADDAPAPSPYVQPGQYLRCYLSDTAGGDTFLVRVTNRERIKWERVSIARKWPRAIDAQNLAVTFTAWAAAQRDGLTTLTWEQWEDALEDYDVITPEEMDDPVRPTR
jgi:hypothetical protein